MRTYPELKGGTRARLDIQWFPVCPSLLTIFLYSVATLPCLGGRQPRQAVQQ